MNKTSFTPEGWPTVIPRIVADDPKQLVDFLIQVFDAKGEYLQERPSEIWIDDSVIIVGDTRVRKQTAAFLYVYVRDCDATYHRAIAAGAHSIEKPSNAPYGDQRCMVEDKWGNTWQIATRSIR
jgi:uncharacterized glyoxalase superfamily protein PhnB